MASVFGLPLNNQLTWYKFQITLSSVFYTLAFRFNTRSNRWIMDILDTAGNQILVGIPVLIGRDTTGQYVYLSVPPGTFLFTDDTQKDTQPTLFSFLLDHSAWYIDPTQ